MRKLKILWLGEASFLSTGYAVYTHEILKRLYATGKYDIAELASYGHWNDDKRFEIPWRYYGNLPDTSDDDQAYRSSILNEFGQWKFEETCLDFKPDIVCVPPGELIFTGKGYVPIENIRVGDLVATHTGNFRKVNKTMRRQINDKLYNIYFNGCAKPLRVTDEHPVFIFRERPQTDKSLAQIYQDAVPEFVSAKNVNDGDLIVVPANLTCHDENPSAQIINGYSVSGIQRVSTTSYYGQVYNLEVDIDNSYIVHQACVHNCDPRDWWMASHVERSPFRDLFKWAIMPTVDSIPQQEQWLATFMGADAVFNYCEFGRDYLQETLGDQVNLCGLAPPSADADYYYPMNKDEVRDSLGMDKDSIIIGTVMRNMKRKLYPDLIESFRKFVDENPEISKNVYLYIHCSYPDSGWDIPKLLREAGIGHKVMFTYLCAKCGHMFPSFFQDSVQACPDCGGATAGLPNQRVGCTTKDMGRIMNSFDLYVQYSIAEGFGIPVVEAAMCGIPTMAVDYSAMSSVVGNLNGTKIKVERMYREADSHAYRALPDNEHFIEELVKFVQLPATLRATKGRQTYLKCKSHYSYDKSAAIWGKYFDSVEPQDLWDEAPPRLHQPDFNIPNGFTNEQFARWIIGNVWGRHDKMDSFIALRLMRDLNYRMAIVQANESYFNEESTPGQRQNFQDFNREDAVKQMADLNKKDRYWEERRAGFIQERKLLFIENCKKGIDE